METPRPHLYSKEGLPMPGLKAKAHAVLPTVITDEAHVAVYEPIDRDLNQERSTYRGLPRADR